jgi:hypothetical protein
MKSFPANVHASGREKFMGHCGAMAIAGALAVMALAPGA